MDGFSKNIAQRDKTGHIRGRFYIFMNTGRFHRPQRRGKEDFRNYNRHKAPCARPKRRDDEEERVSKHSAGALPYRLRVRQAADKYAGDRKTKPLPPEKKMTDDCAFVLLIVAIEIVSGGTTLCVES